MKLLADFSCISWFRPSEDATKTEGLNPANDSSRI